MDRPQEDSGGPPDGLSPEEKACYQTVFENLSVIDREVLTRAIVKTPEIFNKILESRKQQAIVAVADSFSRFSEIINLPIPEIIKLLGLPARELQAIANVVDHLHGQGLRFNERDLREVIDLAHVTAVMEPIYDYANGYGNSIPNRPRKRY